MFCFQGSYHRNSLAWSLNHPSNLLMVWELLVRLGKCLECNLLRIESAAAFIGLHQYYIAKRERMLADFPPFWAFCGGFSAILPIFYFSFSQSEMSVSSEWSVFHSAWDIILLYLLANWQWPLACDNPFLLHRHCGLIPKDFFPFITITMYIIW